MVKEMVILGSILRIIFLSFRNNKRVQGESRRRMIVEEVKCRQKRKRKNLNNKDQLT